MEGPKVLEASGSEKGSGGAGELPNRSEDEVFSDAVAEFVDAGSGTVAGTRGGPEDAGELAINVEKVIEKESEAIRPVDCGPVAGKLSIFLVFSLSISVGCLICTLINGLLTHLYSVEEK